MGTARSAFGGRRRYRRVSQQGFFVFSVVVDSPWGSMRFRGDQLHETGSIPEDVPDGVELRWRSGCDVTKRWRR
jgi:hypothetical protein